MGKPISKSGSVSLVLCLSSWLARTIGDWLYFVKFLGSFFNRLLPKSIQVTTVSHGATYPALSGEFLSSAYILHIIYSVNCLLQFWLYCMWLFSVACCVLCSSSHSEWPVYLEMLQPFECYCSLYALNDAELQNFLLTNNKRTFWSCAISTPQ
jgi:hypothetical protein